MTPPHISIRTWAFALWMFGCRGVRAVDSPAWRVTVDVQMVAVSPESALNLAPALRDPATFDKTFAELQEMIGREEADLVGWPVAIASGKAHFSEGLASAPGEVAAAAPPSQSELATSESVNTARYPTEYLPPQVPQIFVRSGTLAQNVPMHSGEYAAPTAFETRNLGVILATEAVVSNDGTMIELSLHSERSFLLGYHAMSNPNNIDGINSTFYQPKIFMAKSSARLAVSSGQRMLLGSFVEAKPAHKVLLFLLRAVAAKVSGKSPSL